MTSVRRLKLQLKTAPPRNPLVAPSMQRKAGAHRKGSGGTRQAAERDAAREVERSLKDRSRD